MKKTNVQKMIAILIIGLLMMGGIESCNKDDNDGPQEEKPVEKFISSNKTIQGLYKSDKIHTFDAAIIVSPEDISNIICDTLNEHYQLTFNNNIPNIQKGSAVLMQYDNHPVVVLVLDAEKSGNVIDFYGPRGDLSYIFYDTELIFTNHKSDSLNGTNVFFPVKQPINKKGPFEEIEDSFSDSDEVINWSNKKITTNFDDILSLTLDTLKYDLYHKISYKGSKAHAVIVYQNKYLTPYGRGNYQIIDEKSINDYDDAIIFEYAKEKTITTKQSFDIVYSLDFTIAEIKKELDDESFKKPIFHPHGHIPMPIIGYIDVGFDLLFQPEINVSLNTSYRYSQRIHGTTEEAKKYTMIDMLGNYKEETLVVPKKEDIIKETPTIKDNSKTSGETVGVNIEAKAKFKLTCIFSASFIDCHLFGVGLAIIPYMDLSLGFYSGNNNNYGHINSFYGNYSFGIDWQGGLYRTDIVGKVQFPLSIFDWTLDISGNIGDWELMKFPESIRTNISISPDEKKIPMKFDIGQPISIKFESLSSFVGGIKKDPFAGNWIYIKDKNGVIGSPNFSSSREIIWTPKSKDDYLVATIFGKKGEVVDSKIIYDDSNEDISEEPSVQSNISCTINGEVVTQLSPYTIYSSDNNTLTITPQYGYTLKIDGIEKQIFDKTKPIDLSFLQVGNQYTFEIYDMLDGNKLNPFKFYINVSDQNNPPSEEEKITLLISVSDRTEKIPTGETLTYDYGQNVTFTAAVSPSNHVITIYDGKTKTDLKNGFNINTLSVGTHTINVYVDYDPTTRKGKESSIVNIEIKEKQEEQPTPQITSVTITGYSNTISNGDTKDFDYGDEVQIVVETDIDCDEISVDFPGYNTDSNNGEKSYKHTFDATESGKVTITATKNGKSSTFYFNIDVKEKTQNVAPKITSVKINKRQITNGDKIKDFNWGDNVPIEVTTDIVCDEITIDYPNYERDTKVDYNTNSYNTSFDAKKYGTVTIVATKNGKTDKFEFSIMVFETVEVSTLPNTGEKKEAHKYSWCNDLVFQAAEKANIQGVYEICTNGEDEYNRLGVSKTDLSKFSSKQIILIVSTSITDLSSSNIIKEQPFQGDEYNYSIDIPPTNKQLYLIVYVGGEDCGSVEIDGYYCGPFNYHYAPK